MLTTVSNPQLKPLIRPFCEKPHSVPFLSLYLNCNLNEKLLLNPNFLTLCYIHHCIQSATKTLNHSFFEKNSPCAISITVSELQQMSIFCSFFNLTLFYSSVSLLQLCPFCHCDPSATVSKLQLCPNCNTPFSNLRPAGGPRRQHSAQGGSSDHYSYLLSIARLEQESLRVLYNISLYIYILYYTALLYIHLLQHEDTPYPNHT